MELQLIKLFILISFLMCIGIFIVLTAFGVITFDKNKQRGNKK